MLGLHGVKRGKGGPSVGSNQLIPAESAFPPGSCEPNRQKRQVTIAIRLRHMAVNQNGVGSRVISGAKEAAEQRCESSPSMALFPDPERVFKGLGVRGIRKRDLMSECLGPALFRKAVGLPHDVAKPAPKGCCLLAPQPISRSTQLPFLRQGASTNPSSGLLQGLSRKPQ